ncbi:MAG: hypothetical protein ABSF34_15180 [Verrucomicrobiota bacterium]
MTDSELDQKLAAARPPKLEPDYAADFSRTVLTRLRSASTPKVLAEHHWLPRFAWGAGFALVFLLAGFALGHWRGKTETTAAPANDLLSNVKLINETLAMFPNRVRAIIQNEQGTQLVLADQPDVPDSPPLFVKICDGKHCSSLVTFSGQDLEVAGQKITVLSDANGGIILEGSQFVWSSTGPNRLQNGLKIEAKSLASQKL